MSGFKIGSAVLVTAYPHAGLLATVISTSREPSGRLRLIVSASDTGRRMSFAESEVERYDVTPVVDAYDALCAAHRRVAS